MGRVILALEAPRQSVPLQRLPRVWSCGVALIITLSRPVSGIGSAGAVCDCVEQF